MKRGWTAAALFSLTLGLGAGGGGLLPGVDGGCAVPSAAAAGTQG